MEDKTHIQNRRIATTMAVCALVLICLQILNALSVFDFDGALYAVITVLGFFVTLSPMLLFLMKVPDQFLKYYMFIAMAVFIGALGCFNNIGIYITFVLVPLASCQYFDEKFTHFCSVFSYIVMVVAVYINSAGKLEVQYLGWTHLQSFRAYLIGFTLEYVVVALFIVQNMRRVRTTLEEQHQAYLLQEAQDARYQLLMKETGDIIFEYYPQEGKYVANRSIYKKDHQHNTSVEITDIDSAMQTYPGWKELYNRVMQGFRENHLMEFEVDMSYKADEKLVLLWFNVECFVVTDGEIPVSMIGKMHDITRIKENQEMVRRQQLENIYNDSRRQNSIFRQIEYKMISFDEADYNQLAAGHRFLAKVMEDVKYSENLVEGINQMLEQVGNHFAMDRICVVETDMSSGTCFVRYQWNSRPENRLVNYFPSMTAEEIQNTIAVYDTSGYIEVNPEKGIITDLKNSSEFIDEVVFGVLLGNQLWIPMLANGKYIGAVCFDRYDTTPYDIVQKFLLSEAVNTLTTHILKINAENENKAKSDFISTMSHEIRTPMNAIIGMTEVALREDMSESVKRNLRMVKSSAFGLLTLINDILDYSKIEAGRFEIVPEKFSLLSVLYDVIEMTKARNKGKLEIETVIAKQIPAKLYGDSVRIRQVMVNYCTNAIKYSDQGKVQICVDVQKEDEQHGKLYFAVKDQGIGIRKEDLPKLFQSYTRVDTTVNHHKEGTGLGLAISRQLMELMNGTVSVESEYGKGSTFSFTVPVEVVDWSPAGQLENFRYEEEESVECVVAPKARVLIVDDTPLNLMVAEALLEPTQIQIDTAQSGLDALKQVEEKDFDLIFMDHFMPGMDGVETTLQIRALADERKNRIPVVALTADAMEGVREELLSKGMNDFLPKPIMIKDLYQILRKWLPQDKLQS